MKKNLPLVVGVGLPLFIVVTLFVFVYLLPSIFVRPSFDFLYVSDAQHYRYGTFKVEDGRLAFVCEVGGDGSIRPPILGGEVDKEAACERHRRSATLYIYDVERGANTPVSFAEAQELRLDPSDVAPDGYRFMRGDRDGEFGFFPFFFGGGSSNGFALQKSTWLRKPVTLQGHRYQTSFLGWIVE